MCRWSGKGERTHSSFFPVSMSRWLIEARICASCAARSSLHGRRWEGRGGGGGKGVSRGERQQGTGGKPHREKESVCVCEEEEHAYDFVCVRVCVCGVCVCLWLWYGERKKDGGEEPREKS